MKGNNKEENKSIKRVGEKRKKRKERERENMKQGKSKKKKVQN